MIHEVTTELLIYVYECIYLACVHPVPSILSTLHTYKYNNIALICQFKTHLITLCVILTLHAQVLKTDYV